MASPQALAGRRRQRSTRLTVAVLLLVAAAALVVVAIASGSLVLVAVAAAAAVVLGAAATRITHSELAETRREAAEWLGWSDLVAEEKRRRAASGLPLIGEHAGQLKPA